MLAFGSSTAADAHDASRPGYDDESSERPRSAARRAKPRGRAPATHRREPRRRRARTRRQTWRKSSQFQLSGRDREHHAPGFQTIRTRIASTASEARVVERERGRSRDRAVRAPRSARRRRRRAARRARGRGAAGARRPAERDARRPRARSSADHPRVADAVAASCGEPDAERERRRARRRPTTTTAGRVRPSRSATSLGRSRRSAASWRTPTTTAPRDERGTRPATWKSSSHSYFVTARA